MEIVLKKDYGKLGHAMNIVNVRDGYARNFLIPHGIAVIATEGNKKQVADAKRAYEKREEQSLMLARELLAKIEETSCTIAVKVGEEEQVYGSVTANDIANSLKEKGFAIEKRQIELDEPIKQLGVYNVTVNLYKSVNATLKVWVVKEE